MYQSFQQTPNSSQRQVTHDLVKVFPVILRHEPEGAQQRPGKAVEACVASVRIVARFKACVVRWALPATTTQRSQRSCQERHRSRCSRMAGCTNKSQLSVPGCTSSNSTVRVFVVCKIDLISQNAARSSKQNNVNQGNISIALYDRHKSMHDAYEIALVSRRDDVPCVSGRATELERVILHVP